MADKNTIIKNCKKYLGKPYVWGGESDAEGGFDCSGYAYNVFRDSGYKVNRLTADGYRRTIGKKIDKSIKDIGDVLFFGKNGKATHVAFYAGNEMMYESVGGSKNTKKNPGKGVTLSKIKRKDLIEVRRIVDDIASSNLSVNTTAPRSWLQKGDEGQKVKDMQLMLIAVGFSCGKYGADGDFGASTYTALTKFQKTYGLTVDGLYGEKSKEKLEELYKAKVTPVVSNPIFAIGKVYTLQVELKVRTGAGTNYSAKKHFALTRDGQKHDADGDGALDKGTRVTCKQVKVIGKDTWIKTPSGWLAAIYNGKVYIK